MSTPSRLSVTGQCKLIYQQRKAPSVQPVYYHLHPAKSLIARTSHFPLPAPPSTARLAERSSLMFHPILKRARLTIDTLTSFASKKLRYRRLPLQKTNKILSTYALLFRSTSLCPRESLSSDKYGTKMSLRSSRMF
jgi:hypothetical protein